MDQQEQSAQQRRSRARRKPEPIEEQANQPSMARAQEHGNLHGVTAATKQQDQPPAPPEQPKTDDDSAWSNYRDAWQAYTKAWGSFWEAQGQPHHEKGIEGADAYRENWIMHWQERGLPWRTEPEIDAEQQEFLAKHHSIKPDIEKYIYPFKDIKLNRADVEWLLQR